MKKGADRRRSLLAVGVPGLLGAVLGWISIEANTMYGLAVFVVMPLVVGWISGVLHSLGRTVTYSSAVLHGVLAAGMGAFVMFFAAIEGLLCLLMVMPLGLALAAVGGALGRMTSVWMSSGSCAAAFSPLVMLAAFPVLLGVDRAQGEPKIHKVVSVVEIDAPIERVWETVIAFPPITEPPSGILSTGIAYPIEATIEGEGVGAKRYCTFSTGSFVEPITHWEEPHLLAFDVVENPPAMRETSIYHHLETPHMTGHLQSHKGQFRLYEREGRVVVEGTTWYSHSIAPQWYWRPISDHIIHAVHHRVLNHIKEVAERD